MHNTKRQLSIIGAALLLPAALSWAQPPGQGQLPPPAITPDPVAEQFDITAGQEPGSVQVGKRGQGKREFGVRKQRGPGTLDLELDEKGGPRGERKARRWSYKEGQGIGVTLGQQQLDIAIQGQQVQVGAAPPCSSVDTPCIAQAIRAQLQGLTPEESAAALAVLRQDLARMKYGKEIERVMETLATMP